MDALPRVTTVIQAAGLMPDYAHWDPSGIAMQRGSAIDVGCQFLFQGYLLSAIECDPQIYPYLQSLDLWRKETRLGPGIVQAEMHDPWLEFQGHPDFYNPEWTIDTKAAVKAKWHRLQTSFYQYLTKSRRRGSLYLQADGSIAKMDEHTDRADWGACLSALKLYHGERKLESYRQNINRWMEAA